MQHTRKTITLTEDLLLNIWRYMSADKQELGKHTFTAGARVLVVNGRIVGRLIDVMTPEQIAQLGYDPQDVYVTDVYIEQDALEYVGATDVEKYSLVNNYGYKFYKRGKKYDLQHWLNVYGSSVDYWEIYGAETSADFDTLDEAIEYIKML